MSDKKTEGNTLDQKSPDEEEGSILGIVMDRTGDTRYDGEQNPLLTVGGAVTLARDEMAKGKWLRTVNNAGESDIIRDIKDIADDVTAHNLFEDVSEMEMMAALVGG
jgi:hypothetical protein